MGQFSGIGRYGLLAVLMVVSGLEFEKSPILFGSLLVLGMIMLIISFIVDWNHRKEALEIESYR